VFDKIPESRFEVSYGEKLGRGKKEEGRGRGVEGCLFYALVVSV